MKLNLTEKSVRDFKVPTGKKQTLLFDFELPGFAVSVTAHGVKSYVIVYRDAADKQRQEKLADFGAMSVHAARAVAKARLDTIEAMKPSRHWRRSLCLTMDDFFYGTFLPLIKTQSRSYKTHAGIYRTHLQATFGARRLDDITEEDVLALADTPIAFHNNTNTERRKLADATVKRILILLRHIFNEALRHQGTALARNPTHVLRLKTVRKVTGRFLNSEQLAQLLHAAELSLNRDLPDIIRVMGATGLRRENVLTMKWAWFDASRGTLSIPAECDKAKKGFILYLSSQVSALLSARQTQSVSEWVFPNPKTGKPYHSCRSAWVMSCQRAGIPKLRMHDMRHTFASMMLDSGADIVDVQQALGHTQLKTTAVYLHLTEARKRVHANAATRATGLFA